VGLGRLAGSLRIVAGGTRSSETRRPKKSEISSGNEGKRKVKEIFSVLRLRKDEGVSQLTCTINQESPGKGNEISEGRATNGSPPCDQTK